MGGGASIDRSFVVVAGVLGSGHLEERAGVTARVGDLVAVKWRDAAGFVNTDLTHAVLQSAENVGWIRRMDKSAIILQSGRYDGTTEGDYTAIPREWATRIRVIERASK